MNQLKAQLKSILTSLTLLLIPFSVNAHVGYLVNNESMMTLYGGFVDVLRRSSADRLGIFLVALFFVSFLLLYSFLGIFSYRYNSVKLLMDGCFDRCRESFSDIPWILRLGVGMSLIGAGASRVLISPVLETTHTVALVETILGFMILSGFLITWASIASIIFFVFGLINNIYLLGNLDFLALCIGIIILNNPRPGIDFLFGWHSGFDLKSYKKYFPRILSVLFGLGFIFLAIYEKILYTKASVLVFDDLPFVRYGLMTADTFTLFVLIVEILLGLVFLFGINVRFFAAFAFIFLTFSFFYFQESVFSHVTIFATLSILFLTNGQKHASIN